MKRSAPPILTAAALLAAALFTRADPALRFNHDLHGEDAGIDCLVCHPDPDAPGMPPVKVCRACHTNTQLVSDCALCHTDRAVSRPAFHLPGWERAHALDVRTFPAGACAHCHREEDCRACHVAAGLDSLAPDPRPYFMSYRKVVSPHIGRLHPRDYRREHAADAERDGARCGVCHEAREEDPLCRECHAPPPTAEPERSE